MSFESGRCLLNWEQKMMALDALVPGHLSLLSDGTWLCIHHGVYIGGDGVLKGANGRGISPQLAVEDAWKQYVTELPNDKRIVVTDPNTGNARRYVLWNGFMWADADL